MKKQYCISIIHLLLLSVIPGISYGQEEMADFIYTGNTVRYSQSSPVGSGSDTLGGAVRLTPDKLKLLKGNSITAIRFYQTGTEVEYAKVFVTGSLENQTYDYEQPVTTLVSGWNEIELSQPFPINGTELFIGYEIKAQKPGLGTNLNPENGLNDWYLHDGKWDHIGDTRALCITGIVRGDKLPRYNIRIVATDLPFHRYEQTGQPFNLKASVFNEAAETICNATLQVSVNGNELVTKTVTGLHIPYLSSDTIRIDGITIPEEGEFTCVLTVTKLNGQQDLDMSNNSDTGKIFSRQTFVRRQILIENFSTERCSNCPEGDRKIENAIEGNPLISMVTHHCGFGTDDFTIDESKAYTCFYKTEFAPAFMLDRRNLGPQGGKDQYGNSHTPVAAIRSNLAELIGYALKVPAFATIELEAGYDEKSRKLTISTRGQSILPLPGKDSRLNIFITEDSVPAIRQNGAKGSYLHNHAVRRVLTGTWGEAIGLEEGFSNRHETVLPEKWNAKNINVVAFLSNYDESDVNNRIIYNSAAAQLFGRSGVDKKIPPEQAIRIYVGNGMIRISGEYKSLQIYDLAGKKVECSSLKAGIYLFKFQTLNHLMITHKVVIPNQYKY